MQQRHSSWLCLSCAPQKPHNAKRNSTNTFCSQIILQIRLTCPTQLSNSHKLEKILLTNNPKAATSDLTQTNHILRLPIYNLTEDLSSSNPHEFMEPCSGKEGPTFCRGAFANITAPDGIINPLGCYLPSKEPGDVLAIDNAAGVDVRVTCLKKVEDEIALHTMVPQIQLHLSIEQNPIVLRLFPIHLIFSPNES